MKPKLQLYLASLMAITTVAFFPMAVKAQSSLDTSGCVREAEAYIPPGTLAMMAYRGTFEKEGIPGYDVLETEFDAGNITAEKVVQAAVTGCFLSNTYGVAEHDNYISEVKNQIQDMIRAQD